SCGGGRRPAPARSGTCVNDGGRRVLAIAGAGGAGQGARAARPARVRDQPSTDCRTSARSRRAQHRSESWSGARRSGPAALSLLGSGGHARRRARAGADVVSAPIESRTNPRKILKTLSALRTAIGAYPAGHPMIAEKLGEANDAVQEHLRLG